MPVYGSTAGRKRQTPLERRRFRLQYNRQKKKFSKITTINNNIIINNGVTEARVLWRRAFILLFFSFHSPNLSNTLHYFSNSFGFEYTILHVRFYWFSRFKTQRLLKIVALAFKFALKTALKLSRMMMAHTHFLWTVPDQQ